MGVSWNRRELMRASALGLGAGWANLLAITPVGASSLRVDPAAVTFRPEIEPVVQWIERTPRDRVFDVAVEQLKAGLSYRDLMAGLFLAGIRNIKPRPVGFKFHAVMVINSAHLLAQTSAVEDRLLPMFWALDNFKNSQEADVREGDWTLTAVDDLKVPSATRSKGELEKAFEAWDSDAADAATAGLCRSAGAAETMEVFWKCAIRDHRNIGHKPIFAMQCWRTLQNIGWQHAEPVLRSLSYGILDLQGDSNAAPVGSYEANKERAAKFREDWTRGREDWVASRDFLDALRRSSSEDASEAALRCVNEGVAPGLLWDAILLAGQELMQRAPGILPIHAVTASNALHFIHRASGDDQTRKLALLQAAGWIPLYRERMNIPAEAVIDQIEPIQPDHSDPREAVEEIASDLGSDRHRAIAKAVGFLDRGGSADQVFAMARHNILLKGRDSHDYKFGAASLEEFEVATDDRWKKPLAVSVLANVPAAGTEDSPLMLRAREALQRA